MQRVLARFHQPKALVISSTIFSNLCSSEGEVMSYRKGGAGGGYGGGGHGRRDRRGGPNRGGGRGRGGNGGQGGPPAGLKGRDIGMFYARRSQQNKTEREKNSVCSAAYASI